MRSASELVEQYGKTARENLNGPGEPEAALSQPVTNFIKAYGEEILGFKTVLHEEVREDTGAVRPDYGVKINGLMTGHIEMKRPGTSLDPATYGKTTHNARQWRRLRNLPNLLHTNGTSWRLWRYGQLVGEEVHLHTAGLATSKAPLLAPLSFYTMLNDFLTWTPTPITSVTRLIEVMAPLAAMLREEVLVSLTADRRYAKQQGIDENLRPFIGLKRDWRASLHPRATDEEFADGFAQTVVFSMVIALSEGTNLAGKSIPEIADSLQAKHTLLGRSLDLLTEHIGDSVVGLAIETIIRALSATDWDRISSGRRDVYLHLYENFLSSYDPELRKQSGSYYTPTEVVDAMTRLSDQALTKYLKVPQGLASEKIAVVDPAMGTGTYPLSVLRHVARSAEPYGSGAVGDAVSSTAERLYGIELQSGPYSVAELRLSQAVRDMGGELPDAGLNLYVADTLEDPRSGSDHQLSYTLRLIAEQRRRANRMKLETPIQVCIGNPPYKEKAQGEGGWVEQGGNSSDRALLDDFRLTGNGTYEYVLKNLYVYFWRWAMWKVFESTPSSTGGIVCFITATGYINGPGFKGMREWIRRNTSRGWIINLTPEGKRPPAHTAVFNIETEVAIGLFIRDEANDPNAPADIRYQALQGSREQKFEALAALELDEDSFHKVSSEWTENFSPAASQEWASFPALDEIHPWTSRGIQLSRNWVVAPSKDLLEQRWDELLLETDPKVKASKFKESRDSTLTKTKAPLAGADTEKRTRTAVENVVWPSEPKIVEFGYRSFDKQYLLADSRLIDMPRPPLWASRSEKQLFIVQQHARFPGKGPGVFCSAHIPDLNCFNNRGGLVMPLYHPDGSANIAPGLLSALTEVLGMVITPEDLSAYIAGVSAHPGYTDRFQDSLRYSSNRVPITADPDVWKELVGLGRELVWLHTFGKRGESRSGLDSPLDQSDGCELPDYALSVGSEMPECASYDEETRILSLGAGRWHNVDPRVWEYAVGGVNIIESWVGYRRRKPRGRKSSPLDNIILTSWTTELSREFHELLAVLTRLIVLEEEQASQLDVVLESELLSHETLHSVGVQWPKTAADKKPRVQPDNQNSLL